MIFWVNLDVLRAVVPQGVLNVSGERSLSEKLEPELTMGFQWLENTFGDLEQYFPYDKEAMPQGYVRGSGSYELDLAVTMVIDRAFYNTFDALNVILTSNGFGVVSNQQVAPASKDRTDAYKKSLARNFNRLLVALYGRCLKVQAWREQQWTLFGRTLVGPNAILTDSEMACDIDAWSKVRPTIYNCEQELAEKALSDDLYEWLFDNMYGASVRRLMVVLSITVTKYIYGRQESVWADMQQMVQIIRLQPELKAIWENTATAKGWNAPGFENKREAGGVWL